MKINNWRQKYLHTHLLRNSIAVIKLRQLGQIWLLNCFEGCQHALARKNIKIAQISKIMLIHDNPSSVNGLLGLLSTISLSTKRHRIDIYGPKSLWKYIFLCRKYSKTNFRHDLYVYDMLGSKMIQQLNPYLHPFISVGTNNYHYCSLLDFERSGVFNCGHAKNYSVPPGLLYGYLKAGQSFILPDGFIIYGRHFIYGYYLGCEVAVLNYAVRRCDLITIGNAAYVIYD